DLRLVLDEDRAQALEPAHDVLVVDDLMADVDGCAVLLEQALDDLDRTVDAGAEGPGCCQQDAAAHATAFSRALSATIAPKTERTPLVRFAPSQRSKPSGSVRPSGCTVVSTPSIALVTSSEMTRTTPASRPLRASTPLSMSTASAPLASCRRLRSRESCTRTSEPSTVAASAPGTPSGPPSQSVAPC